MLIPDNVQPERTIYFNAAIVLKAIQENRALHAVDLFLKVKAVREMNISVFVLCLDWLFLLEIITINDRGKVVKCS